LIVSTNWYSYEKTISNYLFIVFVFWNNANNWTGNELPTSANSVIIPSLANNPIINQEPASPAVCKNLTIQDGASVTINAGKALTIQGTLEVASTATFIVNSNAIVRIE